MTFYERASGSRLHANYFRTGGVHKDLPTKLIEDIDKFCNNFPKIMNDLEDLLLKTEYLNKETLILDWSQKDALDHSFTGVMLRGSGIPWDLKKISTI